MTIREQIRNNFIAILSLLIACTSLIYISWRNQTSEHNRNLRVASFDMLRELGELQTLVHYTYYDREHKMGNPITGWGRVLLIKDLAMVCTPSVQKCSQDLLETWESNWSNLETDHDKVDTVIASINQCRMQILGTLEMLR